MGEIEKIIDIPADHERNVCGRLDENLTKIERTLHVNMIERDGAMKIIEKICKSRKQLATSQSPISGTTGVYVPYPVEVMVGGATIFVLDVEQFIKI